MSGWTIAYVINRYTLHHYNRRQALVYVNSTRAKNPQFIRWVNALADYDYEILHRKRDKMGHVEALSRAPVEEYTLEGAAMSGTRHDSKRDSLDN